VKIAEKIAMPNNIKIQKGTCSQRDQGQMSGFLLQRKKYMLFLFYVNGHYLEAQAKAVFCLKSAGSHTHLHYCHIITLL
jgi:hypothetical protein